jgi:IS5 family transposase
VECISKGKAHKRYEFGVKASIATTNKSNFVVGGMALPGNPYDGHTLTHALEQVRWMTGSVIE